MIEYNIENFAMHQQTQQPFQEAKAREQSQLGNAEKQKIIMQISAVQTELVRMMDER